MRREIKGKDDKDIVFLIVDDVPNMRRTLRNMLKYIGYKNFIEADNGRIALARLSVYPINFIITDLNMPVMDGLEFIKKVRAHKDYKFLPIIIISGESDKDIVAEAAEIGADGYLIKPFLVTTVDAKIKSVVDAITNPDRATYHYKEGYIYLERGNYSNALEEFKAAIKIDPLMTSAYGGMAKVFIQNNQFDKAVKVLNEALKINDKYIEGYHLLGEIFIKKGQLNEAEPYLLKAYQLSPKNFDRIVQIGNLCLNTGKEIDAEKYFNLALKESSNKIAVREEIADIYLKQKRYDKAVELYDGIVMEKPNYLLGYNKLGIAFRKQKKFDKAIEAYKKALQFGGEDEYVYYNIARTYYEKGDIKGAIKNIKKALSINDDFDEAKKALEFFKKNLKSDKNGS